MSDDLDPEIDELLGAYALDALEGAERDRVARYVDRNPVAQREVDDLRETAAMLALTPLEHEIAPPELWDRIATAINDGSDAPAVVELSSRRRAVPVRIAAPIAAVAAALIAVLAVTSLDRGARDGYDDAFASAARDGRTIEFTGAEGVEVALDRGRGYLRSGALPELPGGKVYQAWAVYPQTGSPISIGVLGAGYTAFEYGDGLAAIAITVEDSPGVVVSRNTPVATATL
jgi:hypothetical protein